MMGGAIVQTNVGIPDDPVMMSDVDGRGIKRGKCKSDDCRCEQYDGGMEKKKCVSCEHPPGRHENLTNPCPSNSNGLGPSISDEFLSISESSNLQTPEKCHLEGCEYPIYYDGYQFHTYCSPMCRDKDLLQIHLEQLQLDIDELEKGLKSLPANDRSKSLKNGKGLSDPSLSVQSKSSTAGMSKGKKNTSKKQEQESLSVQKSNEEGDKSKSSTAGISKGKNKNTSKKQEQERYKRKEFMKEKSADFGIIVCEHMWCTEDSSLPGFLITGVKVGSKCFKLMQNSQLRFFEIITEVNDCPVKELPGTEPKEKLDRALSGSEKVILKVHQPTYMLKTSDSAISKVKEHSSHIIAVVHPANMGEEMKLFGIKSLDQKIVHLSLPFEHSSAYLCGLRDEDRFKASLTASKNPKDLSVHSNKDSKIMQRIKTASEKNCDIIIAVQRK